MGWFDSKKIPEKDYDSIITTTGDLKEEYSIMGNHFFGWFFRMQYARLGS